MDSEGHEEVGLSDNIDVAAWQRLVTQGDITLGGVRAPAPALAATTPAAASASAFYTTSSSVSHLYLHLRHYNCYLTVDKP